MEENRLNRGPSNLPRKSGKSATPANSERLRKTDREVTSGQNRHQARELEDPTPEACKVVHRSRSVPHRPRPGARPIPPGASPG